MWQVRRVGLEEPAHMCMPLTAQQSKKTIAALVRRMGVVVRVTVLVVAPMSGHFATLLRGTVERMLGAHDVYITDWRDAKLVPTGEGSFDHPATLSAFALGFVLFLITLGLNIFALRVVKRFREAYE